MPSESAPARPGIYDFCERKHLVVKGRYQARTTNPVSSLRMAQMVPSWFVNSSSRADSNCFLSCEAYGTLNKRSANNIPLIPTRLQVR